MTASPLFLIPESITAQYVPCPAKLQREVVSMEWCTAKEIMTRPVVSARKSASARDIA
ncbi:MAG: hypothetical protein GQ522_07185, partial [Deltaproteobacteria bacterium]|nr:hypothetical protein [Deltaproteobacteria bacterium]